MQYDVLIIGAGVIGAMAARELCRKRLSVCLLEKENDVACGASRANSGIIHGGFDPEPGTLKAKLNAAGVEELFQAAQELHVPHRRNGSLVCAFGSAEEPAVRALYQRGLQNGIGGMALLTGDQAQELEPQLSPAVTLALHVPSSGIICPYELTVAAVGNAMDNGAALRCNFAVANIQEDEAGFLVTSDSGEQVRGTYLLNCAGGHSGEIAVLLGDDGWEILPRAGEYLLLDKSEGSRVRHTIFQTPTPEGKGVLVTPTVDGNLLTGPTANQVSSPESRDTTAHGLDTVRHLAAKSVPGLDFRQVITSFAGVRASIASKDFILQPSKAHPKAIHALAIDSPGLSCCVSIAKYLAELLEKAGLSSEINENFNPIRSDPHAFRRMSDQEQDAFIRLHPDYGQIVCRCETISEGEILEALRRNPPARDLDGVKRRTRSGMGRCQGGFCTPHILELLSRELGIPMEQVTKSGPGSEPITGRLR